MELLNLDVEVNKIMLDPLNPRFEGLNSGKSQSEILSTMWALKDTKELMSSMELELQWVNSIVVREIASLSEEDKKSIPESDKYDYIVVEGNTRLACLKHKNLVKKYGEQFRIPVLVANKGSLSQEEFDYQIKQVQARANVMIVKEWDDVPKFKHLYGMYVSEKKLAPQASFKDIVARITTITGGQRNDVRMAIMRCMIVEEIAKESDTLENKYWPFLEAFENNETTRSTIGLNSSYEFDFSGEDGEYKNELLNRIPDIIKDAFAHLPNGKDFRNKYKEICAECGGKAEDILVSINDIMDGSNENKTWKLKQKNSNAGEDYWKDTLSSLLTTLKSYPVMADWASKQKSAISLIAEQTAKLLSKIDD